MTDDGATPLVCGLESDVLEEARRRVQGRGESCIYVFADTGNGASLVDDLRRLARYFEIVRLRVLDGGLGVIGVARPEPADAEPEVATLLEHALRDAARDTRALRDAHQETTQQLRESERALRRRTIELLEADRRTTEVKADKETHERKLRLAQLQTEKVKRTLSFRLGHALIHKTKTVEGVLDLPRTLWRLQQDASDRRQGTGSQTTLRRFVRSIVRFRDRPIAARPGKPPPRREPAPAPHFEPPFAIPTGAELRRLRVAGIFDEFTTHAFDPECELVSLDARTWRAQLEAQPPHVLFVESAWQGAGGSWDRKINQLAVELRELVQWCRDARIPTAFWNKEDPVHFGTFLNTAALFDAVFTTDFDCIHRYRDLLGHDRVYLLPFACQPRQHNPIEKYERKDAACFAGAYYARYPERQRDFLRIVIKLLERGPVEIFDRNHGKTDPDYQFPASYRDYIVGNLPFAEIDRAYKGYRYAININSIKTSQTMFARRVFELLASNTLTASNYAKGIRVMFGDLVIASDDAAQLAARLGELDADPTTADAYRRIALRKVMAEHTYQDRLAYVTTKLFDGVTPPRLTPTITVVGAAKTPAEVRALADNFARQHYPHKRLVALVPEALRDELAARVPDAELVFDARDTRPAAERVDGDYVARFAAGDHYGEHYLTDLALATRYHDGPVIGKAAYFEWRAGGPERMGDGSYRTGQVVSSAAAIVRRDHLGTRSLDELARREATFDDALAIDDHHYCRGGAARDEARLTVAVGEPPGSNTGLSLATILDHAEHVEVAEVDPDLRALGPAELARLFVERSLNELGVTHGPDGITIESALDPGGRQYLYQSGELSLAELGFETRARFHLEVSTGLRLQAVFLFFDQGRNRIGESIRFAAMNHELELPAGTAYLRFGVLVVGPGVATIRRLILGHVTTEEPTRIIGRSRILLVTNGYPSTDALYRNAFVHRRVLDYRRAGVDVDVFCHRPLEPLTYHEFEGTDVVSGRADLLRRMIASNTYETVLVHFLDAEIWRELEPRLADVRLFLWIHGAEIHPWHRRTYNYSTPEELESAKTTSRARAELWNGVLHPLHPNVHVITVSRTFAGEIEKDYDVTLPAAQHTVIHNIVDTELFRYEPKPASQRTRILSIRPFATRQYANDLAVKAILELAQHPWFGELDFHIVGDGPLFDDTVAPLRGMRNVLLERRFVRQDEIAELHRTRGVFLCPSRWDSQGVSRDEAMSSGLVPVTTRIAAVPEFVDDSCGFLAPPEDASALAAAIETLYRDPARFQRMSEEAAASVRRNRDTAHTTQRELALFTRRN